MKRSWYQLELHSIPLLIVCGSKDATFLKAAEVMKRKLPHAETQIVENAGHGLVLTHKQELEQIIGDWIRRLN